MKKASILKPLYLSALSAIFIAHQGNAQTYCSAASTLGTPYFFAFSFDQGSNMSSGQYITNTGSNYTNNTGLGSAATFKRYFGSGSPFAIFNPSMTTTFGSGNVGVFVDWNSDGDFADTYENAFSATASITPNTSYNSTAFIYPPVNVPAGTYRLRYTYAESGTPSACGTAFTGETEDFTITLPQNTAPVLSTSVTPLLNNLLAWQTNSEGFTLEQLLFVDGSCIISDPEDISASQLAPKGIAITGQTATNGAWQYKIGTGGSWTAFGAVSSTNALLLSSNTPVGNVAGQEVRIRFVPTGAGTPSFSFQAWDLSTGSLGGYANASVNGGTTAFSTASKTVSLSVVQPATPPSFNVYLGSSTLDNVLAVKTNRSTSQAFEGDIKLSGNVNFTNGTDIELDKVNNRLVWTESGTTDKVVSCDTNGANVSVLYTFPSGTSVPMGIATSPTNLFFTDNAASSRGLYRANLDGSNVVKITGGTSQLPTPTLIRDVEYYNGKLYVITRPASADYKIMELDSTGLNPTEIVSTTALPAYLAVAGGNVYWSENVSGGQIYTKPISGGTQTQLLTNSVRTVRDMIVDGTNSKIYYLDGSTASINPDRYLNAMPLTGGTPARILSLPSNYLVIASDNTAAAVSLPVSLISFTGSTAGPANRLEWTLNTDKPLQVTVERSTDGISFAGIGTVTHTAGELRQRFTDSNPAAGRNVYRLKYGAAEYSASVTLRNDRMEAAIAVHPNPASDFIIITGAYKTGVIMNLQQQVVARLNGEARFLMQQIPAGIYTLQLVQENGAVSVHRIVRQ